MRVTAEGWRAPETAERVSEAAVRASETPGRVSEAAGRVLERVGRASETAGRRRGGREMEKENKVLHGQWYPIAH